MKFRLFIGALLALFLGAIVRLPGGEVTWTGASTDGKLETVENWADGKAPANGDVLVFPATANTNAHNGTPNIALGGIKISADAGSYQINDKFGVTKTGEGQLLLTGACAYSGQTTVRGGSLTLGNANALGTASTLLLDGAKVCLGQGISPSLGPLNVASASVLDFGAGSGSHAVTFANSQSLAWNGTLAIYNWDGDATASNSLAFGTDNTGLNAAQLKAIIFYRDAGKTRLGTAKWSAKDGQLTFTQ
jgi:autotransporter-associated beta strand protein